MSEPTQQSTDGPSPSRLAAILPVKRFESAKTRLSIVVEPFARRELAAALVADTFAALRRAHRVDSVIVVTGEPEVAELALSHGAAVIDDPDDSSHSNAASLGAAEAMRLSAGAVAMLPGDCPLLDPAELDHAIASLQPPELVVIPDRHGEGTNGLIIAPPEAVAPAFGPGSHMRHHARAAEAGLSSRTLAVDSLALDADTAADLALIEARLAMAPRSAELAPRTSAVLRRAMAGRP